jgi:hypothetical protein
MVLANPISVLCDLGVAMSTVAALLFNLKVLTSEKLCGPVTYFSRVIETGLCTKW